MKDTVTAYNEYTGEGNGFSFRNYNADEFYNIIQYALWIYRNKNHWNTLINHAMTSDNSWEKSAQKYYDLYRELTGID